VKHIKNDNLKEIEGMINDLCKEGPSRSQETFLRKQVTLSFISGLSGEMDILDVGCGWGVLSAYLARQGHRVTGVDNNESTLKTASQTIARYAASVALKQCDAQHLDFPDQCFDLVIWEEMLEHLDQPLFALEEGRRVLRPRGKIILSVPNSESPRYKIFQLLGLKKILIFHEHKQNFNRKLISALVRQAGFEIISLTSDFIPIPKLPLSFFLNQRKALAKKYPSWGYHLFMRRKNE